MSVSRLLPIFFVVACSADPIPQGHYIITTGQETDTWSRDPAPVKFETSSIDESGGTKVLQASDKPIESIDVGITGAYFFQLRGNDANGQRRVQALSYYLSATAMAGFDVRLFAGRTDAFCRPPENLTTALGDHPPVGLFWGARLWIINSAASSSIVSEGYDLVGWNRLDTPSFISTATCPKTPCTFKSVANYAGQFGLAIGSDWAMSFDVTKSATATVNLPTGLTSWTDVSGGRTINSSTGSAFVVGPTRTDSASSFVLELAVDGTLKPRPLGAARQGAAATYVYGHGLAVAGGSATGPGVEYLENNGTSFAGIPYDADPVVGAALVAEATGTRVWRVGGRVPPNNTPAPTVVYDIACSSACAIETKPAFDLDVTNAQGFMVGGTRFVFGEKDDGTMVAWRLTDTEAVVIPIREPRKYASVYSLPNGFAALIGGTLVSDGTPAKSIELVAY